MDHRNSELSRRSFLRSCAGGTFAGIGALLSFQNAHGQVVSAAIAVRDDRPTLLMGDAAVIHGGIKSVPPDHGAKRFHVSNWKGPDDSLTWTVDVPSHAEFAVTALIRGKAAQIELAGGHKKLELPIDTGWNRVDLGTVSLSRGQRTLTLHAPNPGTDLELYSLELATPALKTSLLKEARALRSDTAWMRRAKYGLQFHWTSRSMPRHGKRKPYAEAVRDFPVKEFASTVNDAGAGYVILTTAHAEHYFPAPIKSIDRILPGRTTARDLVRDLIEALGAYGIHLLLYYNVGHDSWNVPDGWWVREGFNPERPEKFLANWCSIMDEVGERYGKDLAGWFYDDSCVYYPLNPDFRRLGRSAKRGNDERVICYNPWIWPRCADFQDYFCGEGYSFLKVRDYLPADGTGIFTGGPQQGLQAHTNFVLESDWCHERPESAIAPPNIPKETFLRDMLDGIAHGIVPSVNLEIYQGGGVSEISLDYMKAVKQAAKA